MKHPDDLVARGERSVVDELLLAVDDAGEVDAGLGVGDELRLDALREHDREGRRRDDVAVAGRAGRLDVGVQRAARAQSVGEITDVFAAGGVQRGGRTRGPRTRR